MIEDDDDDDDDDDWGFEGNRDGGELREVSSIGFEFWVFGFGVVSEGVRCGSGIWGGIGRGLMWDLGRSLQTVLLPRRGIGMVPGKKMERKWCEADCIP